MFKTLQWLSFLALVCALGGPARAAEDSWRKKAEDDLAALKVAMPETEK